MTLESGKILGGIGAILMFVGIFPTINYLGIIEIIGANTITCCFAKSFYRL